jgi:uncharacterized protein YcaQ
MHFTNKQARHLMLANAGLRDNFFGKGKLGTLKAIEHLGYVQIDTIFIVERAHHHTLWSRLPDYKPQYLDALVEKDKSVFEYWSHAAAYLPMGDYRYSLIRKQLYASGKGRRYTNKKTINYVYDRIVAEGPLQSKDFEEKKARAGWWEWKDSKRALEQLFMEGKLMAAGRQGFQKVYDLTERVLPAGVNTTAPTLQEYAEYLINKSIRANGLVSRDEIGYLRPFIKSAVEKTLQQAVKAGEVIELSIEGLPKEKFYTTPASIERAGQTKAKKQVKILSPFDNSVIQRKRLKRLFGFDYTIECYLPQPKRKYGYFCLPVLYNNSFAARIDCKADRDEKVLIVKKVFYENGFERNEKVREDLMKAVEKFAGFNGCDGVIGG